MTALEIEHAKYTETQRHNLATEAETRRSNLANEGETKRHNIAYETETNRHNLATETEINRHNVVTEQEIGRHNLVTEQQGWSSIAVQQERNSLLADQNRIQAKYNEQMAAIGQFNAETSRYAAERNAAYQSAANVLRQGELRVSESRAGAQNAADYARAEHSKAQTRYANVSADATESLVGSQIFNNYSSGAASVLKGIGSLALPML